MSTRVRPSTDVTVLSATALCAGWEPAATARCSCETLADVLANAPLECERIAGPLDQVAAALDYVHEQGVVHRDRKPSSEPSQATRSGFSW